MCVVAGWFERSPLALKVLCSRQLEDGIFKNFSLLTKQEVVRKRSGIPPQLHHCQYVLALWQLLPHTTIG